MQHENPTGMPRTKRRPRRPQWPQSFSYSRPNLKKRRHSCRQRSREAHPTQKLHKASGPAWLVSSSLRRLAFHTCTQEPHITGCHDAPSVSWEGMADRTDPGARCPARRRVCLSARQLHMVHSRCAMSSSFGRSGGMERSSSICRLRLVNVQAVSHPRKMRSLHRK